jgi:hypothetical protein
MREARGARCFAGADEKFKKELGSPFDAAHAFFRNVEIDRFSPEKLANFVPPAVSASRCSRCYPSARRVPRPRLYLCFQVFNHGCVRLVDALFSSSVAATAFRS